MKRIGSALSMGLILLSVYLFIISLRETNLIIKFIGLIGSSVTGTVESYYLYEGLRR